MTRPDPGLLGYFFWHAPAVTVGLDRYRTAVTAWHRVLAAHPPEGFVTGWTWEMPVPPWLPGWPPHVFLDVYVVEGFAALGSLNAAVPGDALWSAHEAVAGLSAHGSGGLYQCRAGPPWSVRPRIGDETVRLDWLDRPATAGVAELLGSLSTGGATVWLRQLALGPGPEVLVVGTGGHDRPRSTGGYVCTTSYALLTVASTLS